MSSHRGQGPRFSVARSCERILSGENSGICVLDEAIIGKNLTYCFYEFNGQQILGNCLAHFELPKGTTIVRPFDRLFDKPCAGIRANQMRVTKIVPTNRLHQQSKVTAAYDSPTEWYSELGTTNPFNYNVGEITTVNIDTTLNCEFQQNGLNFSILNKCANLNKSSD